MILFFGTRQVQRDDPEGSAQAAHCPSCGNHVTLQPRQGRTYFHLFWIPLIPIGETQRYHQCPVCKARYAHWHRRPSGPLNPPQLRS